MAGYYVHDFLNLDEWRPLEIDATVPLVSRITCPACARFDLVEMVAIEGVASKTRVRIGVCDACGFAGYMDIPSSAWLSSFYTNGGWDTEGVSGAEEERAYRKEMLAQGQVIKKIPAVAIASQLPIDRSRTVCEVGCGYGEPLSQLRGLGFERLLGLENSEHRARLAREVYSLDVISGAFEEGGVVSTLSKSAPFSLIYSHHVLEHMADPGKVVQICSTLQQEGDYLIFSVPNAVGETSMAIVNFLPHVNSFTRDALGALFERYGYEILPQTQVLPREVTIVARKKSGPAKERAPRDGYRSFFAGKFQAGLGLKEPFSGTAPRSLWWHRRVDISGHDPYIRNPYLRSFFERIRERLRRYIHKDRIITELGSQRYGRPQRYQSLVVSSLPQATQGVVFRYPQNPVLFYK